MAFLELNGVAINIGAGASTNLVTAGAAETNISGGHYQDVRYRKRSWSFKTTPYTEMEALAYAGLIRGEGQLLTFNDTTATTKNVISGGSPTVNYASTVPTGWSGKSGVITAAGEAFDLGPEVIKAQQDTTVNLWTNATNVDPTTDEDFFFNFYDASASSTNYYKNSFRAFRHTDGALKFEISATDSSGWTNNVSTISLADPFDGNFKMLTFVLRRNPESGESNQYMYVNGSLSSSATTAHIPNPDNFTKVIIGSSGEDDHDYSGGIANRLVDFQILPYAAPSGMISGWYNFGQNSGLLPNLKMTGDVTHDSLVTVRGKVDSVEYIHAGGRTKQRISFTLTEV